MSGIFVSYRRVDTEDVAGRLFDHLVRHFGQSQVFMDINGGIERGADFESALQQALKRCDVLLALIGPKWASSTDNNGLRRLDHDNDWVRVEIATAIRRKIPLFPVVFGTTKFPPSGRPLPSNIARLTKHQLSRIRNDSWDSDADKLFKAISKHVPPTSDVRPIAPNNNFASEGIVRNCAFIGRDEELKRLHEALSAGSVAISGAGGIGKTQLAIEYALRHANEYDGVWWLNASGDTLAVSLERLARSLRLDEKHRPRDWARQARLALSTGKHLLVVNDLDRAEAIDDLLLSEPSRTLVTTRLSRLPLSSLSPFPLGTLTRTDAIAVLGAHRRSRDRSDQTSLDALADHLGDHALALAFAGEYLRSYPDVGPEELLKTLKGMELGERNNPLDDPDPAVIGTGYGLRVAESLQLHLSRFSGINAMALLSICAYCATDDVPLDLLMTVPLPSSEVRAALRKLADLSIIQYKAESVGVHRLTQSILRKKLDRRSTLAAIAFLVDRLTVRFAHSSDPREWPALERYASHAMTTIRHADELQVTTGLGRLIHWTAEYLRDRERYGEALQLLLIGERLATKMSGETSLDLGVMKTGIGSVLFMQGDAAASLPPLRDAERIVRSAIGKNNPHYFAVLNNIGDSLHRLGRRAEALKHYKSAARILRAAGQSKSPLMAKILNNIAMVLDGTGHHEEALRHFRKAMKLDRSTRDRRGAATLLGNYANALEARGQIEQAIEQRLKAESLARDAFPGPTPHSKLLEFVMSSGFSFLGSGELEAALAKFRESAEIASRIHGDAALHTLLCRFMIGRCYEYATRLDEAAGTFRDIESSRGFAAMEPLVGMAVYSSLIQLCAIHGDISAALIFCSKAEEYLRSHRDLPPEGAAKLRRSVGMIHLIMGHGEIGLKWSQEAERIAGLTPNATPMLIVECANQTAYAMYFLGQFPQALTKYKYAFDNACAGGDLEGLLVRASIDAILSMIFDPRNMESARRVAASRKVLQGMLLDALTVAKGKSFNVTTILAEAIARTGGDPVVLVRNVRGTVAASKIKRDLERWRKKYASALV